MRDANWKLLCETPLQTGEANPWFAHVPLSRVSDQYASRLMKPWPFAQLVSPVAFDSVKTSVLVSLTPIITVRPMLSPVWLRVDIAACCADSSMLPPLSLAEP